MRAELEVLLENLRSLKREGVQDVFVGEDALEALRERVAEAIACAKNFRKVSAPQAVPENLPRTENVPAQNFSSEKHSADFAKFPAENSEKIPEKPEEKSAENSDGFDPAISAARVASVPVAGTKAERLAALEKAMLDDPVCNVHLHAGKKLVFGEGDPDASIFFCGEAPGAEEETQGAPFVGPAGQLLTKMIAATGLSREQVYIGNILKWRPELPTPYGNRPPTPAEMGYCLPYLVAQAETIAPRVIVALGLTAVNGLLGFDPERRIGAMRGKKLNFRGVPVVATYHPSYLLRNDSVKSKRAAWEDFLIAMEIAGLPISERQRGFFLPKK